MHNQLIVGMGSRSREICLWFVKSFPVDWFSNGKRTLSKMNKVFKSTSSSIMLNYIRAEFFLERTISETINCKNLTVSTTWAKHFILAVRNTNINYRPYPGPPRGGQGGTMTPGPLDFRGLMGFRKTVGFSAPIDDTEKSACETWRPFFFLEIT